MGAKTKNVTFTLKDAKEFVYKGSKYWLKIFKGLGGTPIRVLNEKMQEVAKDKAEEIIEAYKQDAIEKTKRWGNPVEWLKWGVGCPVGQVALCAGGGRRKRKTRRKRRKKRRHRKTRRKRRKRRRKRLGRRTRRKQRGGGCAACLALALL